ncbi:hypothetical protein [Sporolactobacillus sp. CQH2019]|uniref:hypothetical protein n=1 Tax=Sporolactobacillus sp. CQH2019 TaxID=3023512 RepID=UPI0023677999|nr:hypothetical protein [Sporolactobacillus sp. CQH2019]
MIQVKLEKNQLECFEGLNHLWIHISRPAVSEIVNFRLRLILPKGVGAQKNLNHFPEDEDHAVTVPEIIKDIDLIFELFTEEELLPGRLFLTIAFSYLLNDRLYDGKKQIPLMIVPEEMSDQIAPDSEVVSLVEKIKRDRAREWGQHSFVVFPAVQTVEYELSPLEKKYRIQGSYEAFQ